LRPIKFTNRNNTVALITMLKIRSASYLELIFVGAVIAFAAISSAHADLHLSFGLYASEKPTTLVKKFRPIMNSLEKQLSSELKTPVSIKLSISKTYEEGVGTLVNGMVDFARFGPASYIAAHDVNQNISLLVMEINDGKKEFNGVICVHNDSPIKSVADLKGKSFAFGSEESTIGRYLSQRYLLNHDIKAVDLNSFSYMGRHDKVGYAVVNGKYDAGAMKESTFNKMVKSGLPLRSIASFKNVTKPWVARAGLDNKVKAALQKILLNFNDKVALTGIKQDGFTAASDNDYKIVRDAINNNPKFFVK